MHWQLIVFFVAGVEALRPGEQLNETNGWVEMIIQLKSYNIYYFKSVRDCQEGQDFDTHFMDFICVNETSNSCSCNFIVVACAGVLDFEECAQSGGSSKSYNFVRGPDITLFMPFNSSFVVDLNMEISLYIVVEGTNVTFLEEVFDISTLHSYRPQLRQPMRGVYADLDGFFRLICAKNHWGRYCHVYCVESERVLCDEGLGAVCREGWTGANCEARVPFPSSSPIIQLNSSNLVSSSSFTSGFSMSYVALFGFAAFACATLSYFVVAFRQRKSVGARRNDVQQHHESQAALVPPVFPAILEI